MLTALYRTHHAPAPGPVHHYFEHRGYSWYVDVDQLPRLPRWLRPFARFDARDHFCDGERMTHCGNGSTRSWPSRISSRRPRHRAAQARVLGYVFNPLSLYWCRRRRCCATWWPKCTTPTAAGTPICCHPTTAGGDGAKKLYVSPFNDVDGYYLVRAPLPDAELDVTISLHRDNQPAFVATCAVSGDRPASARCCVCSWWRRWHR